MNSTIEMIKQLRRETGAGIMECKRALAQGEENYEIALAYVRRNDLVKAQKQLNRVVPQGKIELYSHGNGRVCVMVEINTETEFASRSEVFGHFSREIALQVTAASPHYARETDIPQQILDEVAREASERALLAGKSEQIIGRVVQGVLEKFKDKHVLLRQAYIRDETINVGQLLSRTIGRIGENIVIRRFIRWELNPESSAE